MLIRFKVSLDEQRTETIDVEWPPVLPLPVGGDFVTVGPYELALHTREFFVEEPTQPWVEFEAVRVSRPPEYSE